jgi:hypothetical protein
MTICPFNRHPPDDELVEAEIAALDGFWQRQFLDTRGSEHKPLTINIAIARLNSG